MITPYGGTGEESGNPFYSVEAEACTLGAALQDARCARVLADEPGDIYYDPRHQLIHAAICAIVKAGKPVDLAIVDHELATRKTLDMAGGTAYLVDLMQAVPFVANMQHYLQIVRSCSTRRKLWLVAKELTERAGDAMQDPEEIREWTARTIQEMRGGQSEPLIPMQDATMNTYLALTEDQQKQDEAPNRILSGIAGLDNRIGGLRGGEYVAIGARPSVGKSILALTFCVNAARQGKRVLLVSLEMNEVQITERVLANESGVPLNMITSGHIDTESWMKLGTVVDPLGRLKLWYSLEATTCEKVRRAAYQLYENGGLDLIAIDYLQLMEATYSKKQSRQEQIAEISRGLRKLAAELKIPILVLTQLNRNSEKESRDGRTVRREPTMSEARESGAIEQDANIFILLHDPKRDEMRNEEERKTFDALVDQGLSMLRIIVDKNRQGKRGRVTVAFDGDHMRFLPIFGKE